MPAFSGDCYPILSRELSSCQAVSQLFETRMSFFFRYGGMHGGHGRTSRTTSNAYMAVDFDCEYICRETLLS